MELSLLICKSSGTLEETLVSTEEEPVLNVLSKSNERKGIQRTHLLQTAAVIADVFPGIKDEQAKSDLIKRLKNDFDDFVSCCTGKSNYELNFNQSSN